MRGGALTHYGGWGECASGMSCSQEEGGGGRGEMCCLCYARLGSLCFSERVGVPTLHMIDPRLQRASSTEWGATEWVRVCKCRRLFKPHSEPTAHRIESSSAPAPIIPTTIHRHGPDPSQVPQRCPRLWLPQVPHTPRHHLQHALTRE